jgi:hypothetical protein
MPPLCAVQASGGFCCLLSVVCVLLFVVRRLFPWLSKWDGDRGTTGQRGCCRLSLFWGGFAPPGPRAPSTDTTQEVKALT